MTNNDRLVTIIQRLNSGQDISRAKEEARELLATLDPAELSAAEQELTEAGLEPQDMHHLCSVHMEMLAGEVDKLKAGLPTGHVIHTLISEHEMILGFLDKLDEVDRRIQAMSHFEPAAEEFGLLRHIAEHLVEAEAHHQREEDVLFPAIEARGVMGPTHVMRMEHQDLRRRKQELKDLATKVDQMDFAVFKKRLHAASKFVVMTLRDHIFKENNILYPTALQAIPEQDQWSQMKANCDKIGYCCFTPKE